MSSSSGRNRTGLAVVGQFHEPREHGRHLEARELLAAGARVADADREVEGEPRDVGERVRRVDRERHEHREDLGVEVVVQLGAVVVVDVRPRDDLDADVAPGRDGRGSSRHPRGAAAGACASAEMSARTSCGDRPTFVGTASPVMMRRLRPATRTMKNSSRLLAKMARKLARSSTGRGVLGEFQNAMVESEPAQLPVEVAVVGQLRVDCLREVEVVVIRIAQARVEHLLFDHPLIIAGAGDERVNRSSQMLRCRARCVRRRCAAGVRAADRLRRR